MGNPRWKPQDLSPGRVYDKLELQKELKEEREAELAKQIASNKIDPNNIEEVNKLLHETAIKQDFLQKDPLFCEKLEWLTPKIEEAIEAGELIDKLSIYNSFFQKYENDSTPRRL